jgi:site-specific recombinase XerD
MPDDSILTTSDRLDWAVTLFLTAKEAERVSPRTLEAYGWALQRFVTWLREQSVTEPSTLTPHHVRSYFVALGKTDFTSWTIHDYARPVRSWLRFLYAEAILSTDIMARVTMPKLDKVILPAFTRAEVQDLLKACQGSDAPERDVALVLLMLDTGVRASEVCALTVADVDPKTGSVMVHQGKGRKDRNCYIGAQARRALLRYLLVRPSAASTDPLFPSQQTGQHLTTNGLLLFCIRLGRRAGVAECHPHKFRRTCAIESLRAGMDLLRLAAMLGHEDLKTLRGYLKFVETDLQAAHAAHGAVAALLSK